jgi:hypothetical protein
MNKILFFVDILSVTIGENGTEFSNNKCAKVGYFSTNQAKPPFHDPYQICCHCSAAPG